MYHTALCLPEDLYVSLSLWQYLVAWLDIIYSEQEAVSKHGAKEENGDICSVVDKSI